MKALTLAMGLTALPLAAQEISMTDQTAPHPYADVWVTEDGHVRHELLPNGRYVEARGNRERAYQGRYEVTGDHIEYWDDTGFTADGDFVDGVLYHGGMVLHRK
ncbi:protein Atu4866 [Paracoccus laeviglucosivorans]|uniref:Protein Atu4866 n=2 Tax=Paracoccus laeviglucosivorans TaxID=1197861 RepID=A0A521ENP6_9RHOB|nr:protein Atu4866 [Paracoccus laeviglucosivorans]